MEIGGTNIVDVAPGRGGRGGHGGRGRRGGRGGRGGHGGRGRCRGNNDHLMAPMDDSGDINENLVTEEDHFAEPFIAYPVLDGESDDDENEVRIAEIGVQHPPPVHDAFQPISIDELGNPNFSMSYPFEPGNEQDSIERYRQMSAFDIVLNLSEPFFNVLRDCSNNNHDTNISMRQLFFYHAFLTLRVLMRLDTTEMYYHPPEVLKWADWTTELLSRFSLNTFYSIRRSLKAYKPEDDIPQKTRGWKVDRAVEAVRSAFVKVHRRPGEFLSFDEGMGQGSAMRNPSSLGKAKPLEGFRFFLLVDYTSKVVLNFMLDTKTFQAESYTGQPGGVVGAIVDYVINDAQLSGKYHEVIQDNYYQTVALAVHMRDNRNILCAGTAQKKHMDNQIFFGEAKRPKPSRQFPKGSLKMSFNENAKVYEYAYMELYYLSTSFVSSHRDLTVMAPRREKD
jgi:hypothetical protein